MAHSSYGPFCGRVPRRKFLSDLGGGFTGLALAAMLQRDGVVRAEDLEENPPPDGKPHFAPKAKSVIWIFLSGGYSHLETFDPKPLLNKFAGKSFNDTGLDNPANSPLHKKRFRSVPADDVNMRDVYHEIYPLQVGYQKRGQCGVEVSDWWPNLSNCVDDLAFVRSMYTTDNDHAAENQFHTGRHRLDEIQPSIGSWIHYGLGTLNENLPQFVVLGGPTRGDTRTSINSYYLGPRHAGVPLALDPKNPLPFGQRPADVLADQQKNEFELIESLNNLAAAEYPDDPALRARIKAYELAFRMQTSVPEALDMATETMETQQLYGLDNATTKVAGERCLAARRLIERGVRFIELYPSAYGTWDSHQKLQELHAKRCSEVDKPVAGLITDLKRRGLLKDTVVVFGTEFGRTPGLERRSGGKDGRDHHPNGFTIWFAGAGIKPGTIYGQTDELGYNALDPAHYVTDAHATVLHLLGLDPRRLDFPGRKRLEIDRGKPITGILS